MQVRILPSSLENPAQHQVLITYLVEDWLAIDAGCLGIALSVEEQCRVSDVIITHTHQDHIASLPIFLTNIFGARPEPVVIHVQEHDRHALERHVLNDVVWPDFTRISSPSGPVIRFSEIAAERTFELRNLRITPIAVNHIVPTLGLAIEDNHSAVVFTSDTFHTDRIWEYASAMPRLDAVFADVSFPSDQRALAEASKHLTPAQLKVELARLHRDAAVFGVHLKSNYHDRVVAELDALGDSRVRVGEINRPYQW